MFVVMILIFTTIFLSSSSFPKFIYIVLGILILCIGFYFIYTNLSLQNVVLVNYIFWIFFVLFAIVSLAIVFYVFSNIIQRQVGWPGFILQFLFFLPCLFIDLLQYLKNEYNLTPNIIHLLLLSELAFVFMYLYFPMIMNKITSNNSIVLLENSRFLDSESQIATGEQVKVKNTNVDALYQKPSFRQDFALSMWIYLNPQGTNYDAYSKEMTIFSYGNGKPKITHVKNSTDEKASDKYRIYFTDKADDKNYYDISLPPQKWNYFVFNTTSTMVDLFIDGKLIHSYSLQQPIQYSSTDRILCGQDNGLDGAICNVRYYKKPLLLSEIANMYNILSLKNPPTFA